MKRSPSYFWMRGAFDFAGTIADVRKTWYAHYKVS